ncbi:MAG: tetratricopeptide repeat protein [Phycisphaerales bacterium]|nr:tetratricopeptide repeat protein [Phycisphaerales bacterium]
MGAVHRADHRSRRIQPDAGRLGVRNHGERQHRRRVDGAGPRRAPDPCAGRRRRAREARAQGVSAPDSAGARRVLLVGWDACDWRLAGPPAERGALACLSGLIDRGSIGDLEGAFPLLAAPLWTSIATGMRPDRHAVTADVACDAETGDWIAVSSRQRREKALWNIVTQAGKRSIVVHWPASHPAERIAGTCIDDRFVQPVGAADASWPVPGGSVHPGGAEERLRSLRVHPAELGVEEMEAFLPYLRRTSLAEDARPVQVAAAVAETASIHAVATDLLEREPWDFAAIRYPLLGRLAAFTSYRGRGGQDMPDEERAKYGHVIDASLRLLDAMLARLVELAGSDVSIVLVSDRGLADGDGAASAAASTEPGPRWHRPTGLVVVAGPHARRDHLVHGASVLDVAPTVLALLGLPAGRDMPGRVLSEALEASAPEHRIATWNAAPGEDGRHPDGRSPDPWEASAAIRHLVSLGYATMTPEEERRRRGLDALAELARAAAQADAADWTGAVESMRRGCALVPDAPILRIRLAACLVAAGRHAEGRDIAERERGGGEVGRYAELVLGMIAIAEQRPDEAAARFAAAGSDHGGDAFLHCQLALAHVRLGRLEDAERALDAARAMDRSHPPVALAAAMLRIEQGRLEEAADEALAAIGMRYRWPAAHCVLGIALAKLGRLADASRALGTSISQQPSAEAHEWMAVVLAHSDWGVEAIQEHRRQARLLRMGTSRGT